jgi:hypothetical protein
VPRVGPLIGVQAGVSSNRANPVVSGNSITPGSSENQLVRDGSGTPNRFALRVRIMQEWHNGRLQTDLGVARGLDEPPAAARDRMPPRGGEGVERAAGERRPKFIDEQRRGLAGKAKLIR